MSSPIKMHPFFSKAVYLIAFFPIMLLSLLPYYVLIATIGRCVYFFSYTISRYRYHVVVQNLARAFPEKPYSEIHVLARRFYQHFSRMIVEMIKSISISERKLAGQIHITNKNILEHYYHQERPMIGLLGHYGNWESLHILPSKLPFQVNALYKPLSNAFLSDIIHNVRTRFGMGLIPAQKAPRQLMKAKDCRVLNLFIADQYPGYNNGYRMKFLNQPTSLFDGAEKLARTTDAVVFYVELERTSGNGWNVIFSLITDKARETPMGEITRCFGERLQQTIRKAPMYWLWSHRRWK